MDSGVTCSGDMLYHTVTCGSVGGVGRLDDELVASVLQHLYPLLLLLDHQRRQGINSALDDFEIHEGVEEEQPFDLLIEFERLRARYFGC